ncbi:MAG: hypothetical protein LBO06_05430, partial [Bacteroidales bacterium]|nr:hypothetical protein [Bacteroidales bacterium]
MKNTIIFTAFWLMTMLNAFANIVPDTIHNNEPKSCSVSLPNDSVINSLGESINVQIDMPPNWGYYFWSSSNGTIVNINSQNNFAFATIDATTTFYFTALFPEGDNLISNGDFELGNTGFYTQYLLPNQSPICYGTYLITDHTSAFYTSTQGNCLGDGLFMCVDGAITANKIVYQQQVIVEPNTYYFFQIDVANINNSQNAMYRPIFNFSINSTPVCDTFEVTTNWCEWQTFYDLWYSGSATQATIIIIDDNTSSDGNDFAIDNISLFKMCQVTDSITFYVNGSPCNYTADLGIDLTVCQGDSVRLWNRTSDTGTCQWSINDYEGDTLTFVANSTQTIYLIMLDSNGCTASASVVVNVQNPPQITFSGDTIICAGGSTTLTASADVSNCTFAWNNGSTGNEIIVSPNIPTTYSVTATTQPLGCSSTAEVSV